VGEDTFSVPSVRRVVARAPYKIARALLLLGVTTFVTGVTAGALLHSRPIAVMGAASIYVMMFSFFAMIWSWANRRPQERAEELRVDAEGISHGGERLIRRDEIKSAVVFPGKTTSIVRVTRRKLSLPFEFDVGDLATGRKVVKALELDASRVASTFYVAAMSMKQWSRRRLTTVIGAPLAIVGTFGLIAAWHALGLPKMGMPFLGGLGFLGYAASIAQVMIPAKVSVGADGVLVAWMGSRRFVPIDAIRGARVVTEEGGWSGQYSIIVEVDLKSGESLRILGQVGKMDPFKGRDTVYNAGRVAAANSVAERINEAVELHGEGGKEVAWAANVLAREARPIPDWLAALKALRDRTQTFREGGAPTRDDLWQIVEDPNAQPTRRAAAAVALGPLEETDRGRLRVAAESSVAPKLRVAFEAAAEDDDARMGEALEAITEAERTETERTAEPPAA
jgi:hypothetical protein